MVTKILREKRLTQGNTVSVTYVISADLTARKDHERIVEVKKYMSDVGSLRFIADTTNHRIFHIVGLLVRTFTFHLKDMMMT